MKNRNTQCFWIRNEHMGFGSIIVDGQCNKMHKGKACIRAGKGGHAFFPLIVMQTLDIVIVKALGGKFR